jgi:hypothetical protein
LLVAQAGSIHIFSVGRVVPDKPHDAAEVHHIDDPDESSGHRFARLPGIEVYFSITALGATQRVRSERFCSVQATPQSSFNPLNHILQLADISAVPGAAGSYFIAGGLTFSCCTPPLLDALFMVLYLERARVLWRSWRLERCGDSSLPYRLKSISCNY